MSHVLLTIPFSHYCERARWALDLSTLDYRESGHLPLIHSFYNRRAGARRTVPALITPQGVLTDSGQIVHYAAQHIPQDALQGAPLYPADQRLNIESWEERADRVLGVQSRAWAYAHILQNPALLHEIVHACDPLEQKLAKPFFGMLGALLSKHYGVKAGHWHKHLRELRAFWQKLDFQLRDGRPFFMGEHFSALDLTVAALGGVLVLPPEYGYPYPALERYSEAMQEQVRAFRQTPTGQHILRLYREHRPAGRALSPQAGSGSSR